MLGGLVAFEVVDDLASSAGDPSGVGSKCGDTDDHRVYFLFIYYLWAAGFGDWDNR